MSALEPVSPHVSFPEEEERVLALWEKRDAFRRSVEQRPRTRPFIFYDGPPFATGLPHYGHLVASTIKDIVPRYWTMRGYRVERRFGWDTHGLPIEMLVEKKLGLSGPTSIRAYGVDRFNETCRANVLEYTDEWRRVITRLGRWIDFDDDYKTMDPTFMESVWWVFKQLWDKGLVYEAFRVMPYSWRLSTSLSNFEANLDYRQVQDPAITVAMPVTQGPADGRPLHLLIWTTTPWTLPSNLAVAVGEDIDYVEARKPGDDRVFVVARERLADVLGKDAEVLGQLKGRDLVGWRYEPLFDYFVADRPEAFVVIPAPHVSTEDGTGLVHMAPDFGEEDYEACKAVGIEVVQSVDAEGDFEPSVRDFAGRNVKAADPDIIRAIKDMGRLVRHDTIVHSYPFCWRSGTPLIYRAEPARFVRVTELRDRLVANNEEIRWVPEAVGVRRFGNWLADARDWNVSRSRFWGTPLPIWRCTACRHETCIGSIAELEERTGAEVTDLHPHRIDHLEMPCEACGQPARRIPDVFDCWFESGSMPYAQIHYPFENRALFEAGFPAQFISEGLDQTRGWFYTLHVLATALYDRPAFRNVIVNGMVLAEDGSKMSKSKQNYPAPEHVFEEYGSDALRAYLINSPVVRAEPLRFSEAGVRDVVRTVLLPLRNAWAFFVQYANVDGWTPQDGLPGRGVPRVPDRPELDRWVLSALQTLIGDVEAHMERYELYAVVPAVLGFIEDLTNWYIRLSRRRFWRSADDEEGRADKAAAYATLYEVLVDFSKVLAPILPFISESIYQNLVVQPGVAAEGQDSVHLCDFPTVRADRVDRELERQVATVRQVVRLGRRLRERHQIKTRQPLARVTVVHHDPLVRAAVKGHTELVADELNVKEVVIREDDQDLATLSFKADFKRLGRRYGKRMKDAAARIADLTRAEWAALEAGGTLDVLGEEITAADVVVLREPRGDVVIETWEGLLVAFDTELDDALVAEGLARETVSRIQKIRKDSGYEITDRIRVRIESDDAELRAALASQRLWCAAEVLATDFEIVPGHAGDHELEVNGRAIFLTVTRA